MYDGRNQSLSNRSQDDSNGINDYTEHKHKALMMIPVFAIFLGTGIGSCMRFQGVKGLTLIELQKCFGESCSIDSNIAAAMVIVIVTEMVIVIVIGRGMAMFIVVAIDVKVAFIAFG